METALLTAQVLLAAVFLATGLTKLTQPRVQLAAGPMGWAADVSDAEFRAVGLLEVLGALGWSSREHWGSRRIGPEHPGGPVRRPGRRGSRRPSDAGPRQDDGGALMEDTIVVLRFNDLGQARHALDELKRLDRKRRLQMSAAALVGRPAEGRIDASCGSEDADGFYLPQGGIVGMMELAALGGSVTRRAARDLYAELQER